MNAKITRIEGQSTTKAGSPFFKCVAALDDGSTVKVNHFHSTPPEVGAVVEVERNDAGYWNIVEQSNKPKPISSTKTSSTVNAPAEPKAATDAFLQSQFLRWFADNEPRLTSALNIIIGEKLTSDVATAAKSNTEPAAGDIPF
ncbi:hypothetical protein FACS189454_08450 [Planctomycetales bacterium]|nr:hypothetical protein FACS189454_08450 [Planctomycetales bacterium]